MNSLRSPALFRTILCDTTAEFQGINSTELPDGATLYNNQTDSLYRLDKRAGTTYDALIGSGAVVKPDDGTAARWFAEEISGASPYYYSAYLNGVATVTIASLNTWGLLGNQAASFVRSNGSASAFTLDATTGLVTYNGPPILALVRAVAGLTNAIGSTLISLRMAISHNNDIPSGATGSKQPFGQQLTDVSDVRSSLSTERIVLLNPGTTLQLALCNTINGDDILVASYQLVVTPL